MSTTRPKGHQTVFRAPKPPGGKSFARIDNSQLQRADLSFSARGILAFVLSMPTDWKHSAESLSRQSNQGLHAIRSALRELAATGHAQLRKTRTSDGKVVNGWFFFESPSAENRDSVNQQPGAEKPHPVKAPPGVNKPGAGKPDAGEPHSGEPGPGKTPLFQTTIDQTTIDQTTEDKQLSPTSVGDEREALEEAVQQRCPDIGSSAIHAAIDRFEEKLAAGMRITDRVAFIEGLARRIDYQAVNGCAPDVDEAEEAEAKAREMPHPADQESPT